MGQECVERLSVACRLSPQKSAARLERTVVHTKGKTSWKGVRLFSPNVSRSQDLVDAELLGKYGRENVVALINERVNERAITRDFLSRASIVPRFCSAGLRRMRR